MTLSGAYRKLRNQGIPGTIDVSSRWHGVGDCPVRTFAIQIYTKGPGLGYDETKDFNTLSQMTIDRALKMALDWWENCPAHEDNVAEREFYANAEKEFAPGRGLDGLLSDIANPGPVCAALAANVTRQEPKAMPILLSDGSSQLDIRRACERACEMGAETEIYERARTIFHARDLSTEANFSRCLEIAEREAQDARDDEKWAAEQEAVYDAREEREREETMEEVQECRDEL